MRENKATHEIEEGQSLPFSAMDYEKYAMYCQFADGPPRFIRPYIPGRPPALPVQELPLLLYIPGIDGTGLAASRQFPALVEDFDLRAMSIPGNDRTSFDSLIRIVR